MNTRNDDRFRTVVNAKLAAIVEASSTKPAWCDAWMGLGSESSEEERLALYQAVRDSGCLPVEAGFYLVSWQVGTILGTHADFTLCNLEEQMAAVKEADGLGEDDFWPPSEVPTEYEELEQEYDAAWDALFAEKLDEIGEHEMAWLLRENPDGFYDRNAAGWKFFHQPEELDESDVPEWLSALSETVTRSTASLAGPVPFRYLFREKEGIWEIVVYPTSIELVGGAHDGEIVPPGFLLDLEVLRTGFERVEALSWHSLGCPDGKAPHVSVKGVYQGREVLVQVLAYAPESDQEPGSTLHTRPLQP